LKKIRLKRFVQQENQSRTYKIDYESLLNEEQLKAVCHKEGPAIAVAGAGTGKTRTLIYRLARLIEDGIDAKSILLLTFTRRAAQEMLVRTAGLLDDRVSKVFGGTFHSFCLSILKKSTNKLGYSDNFNVIDQSDSEELISIARQEIINKYKIKGKFLNKSQLLWIYSSSINRSEPVLDLLIRQHPKYVDSYDKIVEIYSEYNKIKLKSNVMDYDDLLVKTKELLKTDELTYTKIQERFKYIMVDEYQDTNRLQHELVLLLAGKNNNVFVVGDDAQSIYSFRGSELNNILFFPDNFEHCSIYYIKQNYRSTQQVLNLANAVLKNSLLSYNKELYSIDKQGELPKLVFAKDAIEQAMFVAQTIVESNEDGVNLKDIAVLFRSSFHSYELEMELNTLKIPYVKFGGIKLLEAAHIKDINAYLRVVSNPADFTAWNRILKLENNIGDKTAYSIIQFIQSLEEHNIENIATQVTLKFTRINLDNLFKILTKSSLLEQPKEVIHTVNQHYFPLLEKIYKLDSLERVKDIELYLTIASKYKNLDDFLNENLINPVNHSVSENGMESDEDEVLTLSTIHSAKGLEWKVVFIISAVEGSFPNYRSASDVEQLEEERRLFYVAVTRAKDDLYVVAPSHLRESFYGVDLNKVTRFLDNIEEDTIEKCIIESD